MSENVLEGHRLDPGPLELEAMHVEHVVREDGRTLLLFSWPESND